MGYGGELLAAPPLSRAGACVVPAVPPLMCCPPRQQSAWVAPSITWRGNMPPWDLQFIGYVRFIAFFILQKKNNYKSCLTQHVLISRWSFLEYRVDPVNGVVSALAGISINKHLLDGAQHRQTGTCRSPRVSRGSSDGPQTQL